MIFHYREKRGMLTFSFDVMRVPNDSSFWDSGMVSLCRTEDKRP